MKSIQKYALPALVFCLMMLVLVGCGNKTAPTPSSSLKPYTGSDTITTSFDFKKLNSSEMYGIGTNADNKPITGTITLSKGSVDLKIYDADNKVVYEQAGISATTNVEYVAPKKGGYMIEITGHDATGSGSFTADR